MMDRELTPSCDDLPAPCASIERKHRGPLFYLACGGLLGFASGIPLLAVPLSEGDPHPAGYLLILFGIPTGGIAYRIRSREWPIDLSVRVRQIQASLLTLLIPFSIAMLIERSKGLGMAMMGAIVSASVVAGIFLSGTRRA